MMNENLVTILIEYKISVLGNYYLARNLDETCMHILDQVVDKNEWIRDLLGGIIESIARLDERKIRFKRIREKSYEDYGRNALHGYC